MLNRDHFLNEIELTVNISLKFDFAKKKGNVTIL